jgi:broad specificity phosphatase PhoE
MKLFLIRHAQSANNLLGETLGFDDYMAQRDPEPPLTELGHRQAQLVAEHLVNNQHPERKQESAITGYALTKLYCSPMLRTLQTVQPISQQTGLTPEVWMDIFEQGGIFRGNPRSGKEIVGLPGLSRLQMSEQFPGCLLPDTITDQGWWAAGYEELAGCQARAASVAQTLRHWAEEMPDERIALVTHGTFLDTLVRALLELPPDHRAYYSHYNTAITRIDFLPDGYLILRYLNRIQHLPSELITR